jgi:hypothetical protein
MTSLKQGSERFNHPVNISSFFIKQIGVVLFHIMRCDHTMTSEKGLVLQISLFVLKHCC